LCGFVLAYYWNIMWMDSFAMVPLVMLGVYKLVHEGRYRLFVVSLALAIIFNFLMGVFICILVAAYFFMQAFIAKLKFNQFMWKLIFVAGCSLLAIGLTAFITLPTYIALDRTYNAVNTVNTMPTRYNVWFGSIIDVLGNFFAQHHHALRHPPESLPNLFTGVVPLMLVPLFLITDKISRREKFAFIAVLVLLIISTNNRRWDFVLHGFSFPHALPFRYSFMLSFLLVALAYKAYLIFDSKEPGHTLSLAMGGAFFALMATFGRQGDRYVAFGLIFVLLYLILFMIAGSSSPAVHKMHLLYKVHGWLKSAVPILFIAVLVFELSIAGTASLRSTGNTPRQPYPLHEYEVQRLLNQRDMAEPNNNFFRTEFTRWWSTNDTSMYSFRGWSLFTSMFDYNLGRYVQRLGLPYRRRSNSINYAETTPLTNAFLNVRYIMSRAPEPETALNTVFWVQVYAINDHMYIMRNRYALPLGFMVRPQASLFEGSLTQPFASQNELFRLTTGLQGDLFTLLPMTYNHMGFITHGNVEGTRNMELVQGATEGILRFEFVVPRDGPMYGFIQYHGGGVSNTHILRNHSRINTVDITHTSYVFFMGNFEAGDIATIESHTSSTNTTVNVFGAMIDYDLFAQGHAFLASEPLNLTHVGDTRIEGTVTTAQGGLLYTSIPHAGNWRAIVNGQRAEVVLFGNAMVAVELTAGTHDIVFRYVDSSFRLGLAMSLVSLAVLVGGGFVAKAAAAAAKKR